MKKVVILTLVVASFAAELAMARPHHGRHDSVRPMSDYSDGVLAGILLSTSAIFASEVTANMAQAVYLHADQDAAVYLAEGGEPTPALAQAMNYERDFLARNQVQGSSELSNQDVAYLVMRRAESL